ncbi:MAG: DUF2332 domain-containing protein [Thermoleophilia bacterium]|nr:DUF2332 domain-containing protein [Thermoleophilia bacterium]
MAALVRRCAADPELLSLVPAAPAWDVPHRMLAAVEYLILAGEAEDYRSADDGWASFRSTVAARRAWVEAFVRERTVQTNEPQRSWALLPLFLTVARAAAARLDVVELGASAGLNLLWDRYRYGYAAGAWGDERSPLRLRGDERAAVPADLLATEVDVRRRRGIDLAPLDATSEEGLRTLLAFRTDLGYRTRVRGAAAIVRAEPPELIAGDYVELLPDLLRDRDGSALTVVFQTLSTVYLADERRDRLRELVERAGREGPLAWISTPTPDEHGQRRGDYPLELALWPGGERRIVARMDNHGTWLEWLG